jgi:hypothetical protein
MDSSEAQSTPADPKSNSFVTKVTWHSRDVAHVEAKILRLCKEDFGIPKDHHSAPVKDSHGVPISNSLFLPPPGARLEDYHWNLTGEPGPPPRPEHRELWIHVTKSGAHGLSGARTPLELCMATGHSMLGTRQFLCTASRSSTYLSTGWLSMLHRGFLHRDVAIAGVYRLPDPMEMTAFAPGNFEQILGQPEAGKDDQILQDQVERLRQAIADLGITGACCGVLQPSDMTVEMKGYYASGDNAHQSVSVGRD